MKLSLKHRVGDIQEVTFLEGTSADIIAVLREFVELGEGGGDTPKLAAAIFTDNRPRGERTDQADATRYAMHGHSPSFDKAAVSTVGKIGDVYVVPVSCQREAFDLQNAIGDYVAGKAAISMPYNDHGKVGDVTMRKRGMTPLQTPPNRHELSIFCGDASLGRFVFNGLPEGTGFVFGENYRHGAAGFKVWLDNMLGEIAKRMNYARGDLCSRMTPKRDTFVMGPQGPVFRPEPHPASQVQPGYTPSPHPASAAAIDELDRKSRDALREFAARKFVPKGFA